MQPFVAQLRTLRTGTSEFVWKAGRQFFEEFGDSGILDADITVTALVSNHGLTIGVKAAIAGSVTVPCDRCLENLVIPVDTSFEETYTPESDVLDISQEVYDYVLTSLPMVRVHPEGECNGETTKYLEEQ
ncbi:MAG: DUF177 domain-containing protein [Bacteroidales bacterium]|nr:DUF177 domain-containing protein [Bacteroidales bacterium]